MTLAAVLLAGGESRRMGCDKAILVRNGVPLWENQITLLRHLSPTELFVSARNIPAWLPADARFVADLLPARGPLGGIASALAAMSATHLMALPIDMPLMTGAHLASLWQSASKGRGVLPCFDGGPEPLPAIYPAAASAVATGMLAGPDVSLQAFARTLIDQGRLKKQTLPSRDANLYVNCNSSADWQCYAVHSQSTHD